MRSKHEAFTDHEPQQAESPLAEIATHQRATYFDGELWDDVNTAETWQTPIVEIDSEIIYSVPWFGFRVGDIRLRKLHPSLPYILLSYLGILAVSLVFGVTIAIPLIGSWLAALFWLPSFLAFAFSTILVGYQIETDRIFVHFRFMGLLMYEMVQDKGALYRFERPTMSLRYPPSVVSLAQQINFKKTALPTKIPPSSVYTRIAQDVLCATIISLWVMDEIHFQAQTISHSILGIQVKYYDRLVVKLGYKHPRQPIGKVERHILGTIAEINSVADGESGELGWEPMPTIDDISNSFRRHNKLSFVNEVFYLTLNDSKSRSIGIYPPKMKYKWFLYHREAFDALSKDSKILRDLMKSVKTDYPLIFDEIATSSRI